MAPHAAEWLASLLRSRPGRLEYAVRLASICALTALVAEFYQTPDAALTVYIAFFLNKADRGESLLLNIVLLLLVTLIIAFTTLIAMAVVDARLWRFIAIAVISFGFFFLTSASKLRPLGTIIALIIAYALDLLGTLHGGEIATRELLYAWLFVGIPAGASVVINLLFAPAPRKLAERAIAERLHLSAEMLRAADERVRRDFGESRREGIAEIQNWLKLSGVEKTSPAAEIAALRQAARSTAGVMAWVDAAERSPGAALPDAFRVRLAQTLEEMASILNRGGYPMDVAVEDPIDEPPLSALAANVWSNIKSLLEHFAEPRANEEPAMPRSSFLLPDAFTNPEHVQYALKGTAAAMFCYVLYSLLDWPGIHTCFITCFIVALTTTAETVEKLSLRILGCLIGAAAGTAAIVFLLPSLTSAQALLATVFAGALLSAWVVAGPPRISYAGFQIAFAYFLCVIQGASPDFDLTIARDRIIGILIGNLVMYLVFTRIWPVSVAGRVDAALTGLLERLRTAIRTPGSNARHALAVETDAALGAIERDLELAEYEPAAVRPAGAWLQARRQSVAEIGDLQASLLLMPADDASSSSSVARALDRLRGEIRMTADAT